MAELAKENYGNHVTVDGPQTVTGAKTFSGFTALGAGPAIKMKKLTGTTAAAEGADATVAHGLTGGKIISHTTLVSYAANSSVPPSYTWSPGVQYDILHDATNFIVRLSATNSGNILSKSFTILVIYEE
jgi:hypothetical protein